MTETPTGVAVELEYRRTDLRDGDVEIVDRLVHSLEDGGELLESRRSFKRHANGEDPLNDTVVEVSGDAVPIVKDTEDPHPIVQPRVLDGNTCRERQCLGHGLVLVAEFLGPLLVGEVEIAVDGPARPDGKPEERLHRGVVFGESIAVGVLDQVLQTQWFGIGDEEPENTPPRGATTYPYFLLVAQSDGQELLEPGTGFVEDAQSAVASINQGTRLFNQVAEKDRQIDIGLDHEHGVHQAAELGRTVDTSIRHPRDRSPWQRAGATLRKAAGTIGDRPLP